MYRFVTKFSLLSAATLVVAQAGNPLGTVHNSGSVMVSGAELRAAGVPSWPIVAGDEISTAPGGLAIVSSSQLGRLEVRGDSRVTLAENHVQLQKGAVGSDRAAIQVRDYMVEAKETAGARNWFVVADQEGKLIVAAHQGDVLITRAGAAPLLVPAGSYALPGGPVPDKEKQDKEKKKKKRRRTGAATAGAATGATILGMSATTAAVVGGAVAASAVTIAAATGDDSPPLTTRTTSEF